VKQIPKIIEKELVKFGFNECQIEQLSTYEALIKQWQKAINLVSPSTLNDVWGRHILDSAQLWPILREINAPVIDLGSGGGLPGIVLAIAGIKQITMVESDTRKCIFLREVSRETKLTNVNVITERIEKTSGINAPIITARALAPLKQLVEWSKPLLSPGGTMVFLKGQDWQKEIDELNDEYSVDTIPSVTDPKARIVILK